MVSVRLKVGFVGATIGLIVLGIFGFILGAMLGGAEQAEGKPITWVIGGVLGAIICAITGAGRSGIGEEVSTVPAADERGGRRSATARSSAGPRQLEVDLF